MSNDLFWPTGGQDPDDQSARHTSPSDRGPDWVSPTAAGTTTLSPAPGAARDGGRTTGWRTTAVAAGLAALVFGGVGVGVGTQLAGDDSGASSPTSAGLTVAPSSSTSSALDAKSLAGVAARVLPSVVSITVQANGGGDTGSGVILRSDGYILTNNHVISAAVGGAGSVTVTFNDGNTAAARIVGNDAEDDLAVIKVDKTGLPAATLGTASDVHVGDPVLAIGSPLGLQGTVTSGIVSSVNRPVQTSDSSQSQQLFGGQQQATTTVIDAIQTDAAINPGNSGGPLVNTAGQVIGINSAIASTGSSIGGQAGNIGVGFAIPVDQAKVIAEQLITTGKATHPLLGVSLADATDSNGTPLARVQSVLSNGPAAKAGIKPGDVIVAVGDQKTAGAQAAIAAIRTHQPGQHVTITVMRGSERKTFTVTLVDSSTAQG